MTERDLSITVIGCSGTYSSSASACSSYLLRHNDTAVLLDAGAGASMELQRHIALEDLDAIVVSHEHPDHWTELPVLYHAYRWGIGRPHMPVYGTAGTRDLLDAALPEATMYTFDWITIDQRSELTFGDITLRFSLTDHPVETLAMLAEADERSIGYSADTGPAWSPEAFGRPIDTFIYEASLAVDMEDRGIPHVSGREAGLRAAAADVGRLVLTHVPPGEDADARLADAEQVFDGPIEIAVPGMTISV